MGPGSGIIPVDGKDFGRFIPRLIVGCMWSDVEKYQIEIITHMKEDSGDISAKISLESADAAYQRTGSDKHNSRAHSRYSCRC
jgi:hypothetical protein